ncbi:MAG: NBR1-Ig-like domain-containing protein [Anaerolineaceae bacterium]|jgi:hypothetical protein
MRKIIQFSTVFLVVIMLLAACNLPLGKNVTPAVGNNQTAVAQTVSAMQTQLASNLSPNAPTPTLTLAAPTAGTTETAPQATNTPQPTFKVGFITDVTIPDNTVIEPGKTFKKTWRLRNDGTGTWASNFKLVFVSGDSMSGPASKTLDETVAPGQTIDVSVDLTAPSIPKTYKGNWMLQTATGTNFGIGPESSSAFTVVIVVQQTFAVTNAVPAAYPATWSGVCPVAIDLAATITATAAGKVTYYFVTPLGNSPTLELSFSEAGTKTTPSYSLQVPGTTAGTIQVYIDAPNHQLFPSVANMTVTCP